MNSNTRILYLNANRIRYGNNEKIIQLVEFYEQNEVNIAMIIETNTKQMTKSINIMKSKFKELERGLEIIVVDSKVYKTINSDWLQGRILNMLSRKVPTLLQRDKVKINNLSRQTGFILTYRKKKLLVIVIYRILKGSDPKVCTSILQYNQIREVVAIAITDRKKI